MQRLSLRLPHLSPSVLCHRAALCPRLVLPLLRRTLPRSLPLRFPCRPPCPSCLAPVRIWLGSSLRALLLCCGVQQPCKEVQIFRLRIGSYEPGPRAFGRARCLTATSAPLCLRSASRCLLVFTVFWVGALLAPLCIAPLGTTLRLPFRGRGADLH